MNKRHMLDTCEMKMAPCLTGTFPSGVRCQNHLCKEFANENFSGALMPESLAKIKYLTNILG